MRSIKCPMTDDLCDRSDCSVRTCAERVAEEQAASERARIFREYEEAHLPREAEKVVKDWWPTVLPFVLKKLGKKKLSEAEKFLVKQKLAKDPKVKKEARRRIASRFPD